MLELGKLADESAERDAIHVAVLPVVANEKLAPGQDVAIEDGKATATGSTIGIVDPFLKAMVFPGQRIFVMLYPNTITSLRHEWTHPVLDSTPAVDAEQWLRNFAERAGLSYARMKEIVTEYHETGEPWVEIDSEGARNAWYELSEKEQEEFWVYFETVTGRGDPKHEWDAPFSCSC